MSAIDYNVFEGFEVTGLPRFVLSRGDVVFTDGKLDVEDGRGKFVEREPNAPVTRRFLVEGADQPQASSARPRTCRRGVGRSREDDRQKPRAGVYAATPDYVHAMEVQNPAPLLFISGTMLDER